MSTPSEEEAAPVSVAHDDDPHHSGWCWCGLNRERALREAIRRDCQRISLERRTAAVAEEVVPQRPTEPDFRPADR